MMYLIINIFSFFIIFLLYLCKRNFFPGDIIFYEGLLFALSIGGLLQFTLYIFKVKIPILSAVLTFMLFTSLIPTILDRSVSITVLTSVETCITCNIEEIEESFHEIYIIDNNAVKKRLMEQIYSKNIEMSGEQYLMTERGKLVYSTLKFLTLLFNINDDYLSRSA